MTRWHIVAAVVFAYLISALLVGLLAGRKASSTVAGYVAADRQFGLLAMYFIIGGTVFSAFAFLGGPGWAYSRGAAVFYILSYGVLGIAPWYYVGPKAGRIGRRRGIVTQAQLVTARFPSRTLQLLMALISVAAFIPYIMLQMSGAGIVISAVTENHIPFWLGALLAYGVVVVYVLFGGVSAVGWTNVFEGIIMMAVAWGLGIYIPHVLYGGVAPMFERIAAQRPEMLTLPGRAADGSLWSWGAYSSSVLSSALGFLIWPHLFMKSFTSRDDKTMRRTVVLFPTFQLFLIPLLLVGFAGILYSRKPITPDFIMPLMILNSALPAVVIGLFCAGALAASMSTGDALLHGAASIAVEDGLAPFVRVTDFMRRRLMQLLVLVFGALAFYLAVVQKRSLVWLLLTSYGFVDQLAPPVYAALYWRRATTTGVLAGLFAGLTTTLFFFLNPALKPLGIHEGIVGVVVNVVVLLAVSSRTRPQEHEHTTSFLDA
ncbi:MAG TPA: sodium:solute symporter family protein [Longimicrobiales bacterium]